MSHRTTLLPHVVLLLAVAGCEPSGDTGRTAESPSPVASNPIEFVGAAACLDCHDDVADRWSGSHHDLAMQPADAATVLGDFDGARFAYAGVTSTFSRREGKFFVETDGRDGQLKEFEIAYTFGVEPLQQYLIEFPDGRLQALSLVWDTRPADQGGQRWFHLYPDEAVDHADELHWTRLSQNWNYMCADCHSTGYRKNYDPAKNRYAASWTDIDVACEACHGPGSRHVAQAESGEFADDSGLLVSFANPDRRWVREPGQPNAHLEGQGHKDMQVESCGRCHARRAPLRAAYAHGAPLTDSYVPTLLTDPLYFPDGQIRDEVYVYGSFLHSRMYAAGVVCTDCHEPHSITLRAEGDALCAQCHAPEVYAAADHHHHAAEDGAPACVDCHMPSRNYMVVDARRDHSFRVPRPDLSEQMGVTDACDACHDDRPDGWSSVAVSEWLGRDASGYQGFAETFHAAVTGGADAAELLKSLVSSDDAPDIVTATALRYLGSYPDPASIQLAAAALADADPLVRLGAIDALEPLPVASRQALLMPLLEDPILSVRAEAARQLAGLDPAQMSPPDRHRLQKTLAEYVAIQKHNADRPEAWLNLGIVYAEARQPETAEKQFRGALRLEAAFEPAYVNLADLYRSQGNETSAETVLREGLEVVPDSAALNYSMGLLTVRTDGAGAALPWLERAANIAPESNRYQYVLAVALHDQGRKAEALAVLERAHDRRPADATVLQALAVYHRDSGNNENALEYALKWQAVAPGDPQAAALVEELSVR